jgi:hypothetical protein
LPAPATIEGVRPVGGGPPAAPPPAGLTVIDYWTAPAGLPADPTPMSTAALVEGLRPDDRLALYDAPGGQPRAYLTRTMSGVPVTVPIVERRDGWVAVLVPTANHTVGWVPPQGWLAVPLHDQLVLRRQAHELTWYRDGALRQSWQVTVGAAATPTPLGRTFILGRSTLHSAVYAGVDVFALGAVPEDPSAVATGLAGAHIGIHGWYRNDFGRNASNGCVRIPKQAQQALVASVPAGTEVVVTD